MYTLSNRFKIFSLSLIILGSLGWFYSYSASHLTLEEVKILLADPRTTDDHFLVEISTEKPVAGLKKLLKESGAVEIIEVKPKDH